MSWRTLSIVLAALAGLTGVVLLVGGQVWSAVCVLGCAVFLALEGAGVKTLGRTRRALKMLREKRTGPSQRN